VEYSAGHINRTLKLTPAIIKLRKLLSILSSLDKNALTECHSQMLGIIALYPEGT
jgi:hypothetical protein